MIFALDLAEMQAWDQHWLFHICAIFGTIVAAIAGATASSRVRMDVFGVIVCGSIAALGGGTLRDILLGGLTMADGSPVVVYWVLPSGAEYFYYATITCVLVFYITRFIHVPTGTIRVADAFSLAFFTILGAAKAHSLGCSWLVSIAMGICTGVAGGALRDILTGNVPYVFRPGELYATASLVGTCVFLGLAYLNCYYGLAFTLGLVVVFVVRMAAVYLNWSLPSYRPFWNKEDAPPPGDEGSCEN